MFSYFHTLNIFNTIINNIKTFTGDNGSLCSVQSSGSDSSSIEKMQCDLSDRCSSSSPQWKRKGLSSHHGLHSFHF